MLSFIVGCFVAVAIAGFIADRMLDHMVEIESAYIEEVAHGHSNV